jgi:23S rRNA (cytidine1920-2'-O)/16S rRNA (cytidine1409-2'-O)-methyltransferase
MVELGRVRIHGAVVTKASTDVGLGPITVDGAPAPEYASRGAHKLAGALLALPELDPAGKRCLDAGASTGGFTDVLLRAGAREVVAVDVGSDQLVPDLRQDPRVQVYDGINIRALDPSQIGGPAELTVVDLSFISLRLVLAALSDCTTATGDLVPMVKPQFEVGRGRLGRGGVVRDPAEHASAIQHVCAKAEERGWGTRAVVRSVLPGPSGNMEFFLWFRRDAGPVSVTDIQAVTQELGTADGPGRAHKAH